MSTTFLPTVLVTSNPQTKRYKCEAEIPVDWSEAIEPLK